MHAQKLTQNQSALGAGSAALARRNGRRRQSSLIKSKCNVCFRKDECLLFKERHSGMEFCLGPFDSQEDRTKKITEDFEREKKQADLDRIAWEVVLNNYLRNVESLNKENKISKKKPVQRNPAAACLRQLSLEWAGSGRRG